MKLSKNNLALIDPSIDIDLPMSSIFELPEKVLQFGTGVLLRGLPDYFIDKANKQGLFNGRVVVVKSTSQGKADAFEEQDGLYTLSVRGYDNGAVVDKYILNASISRVVAAGEAWKDVLDCAGNADMQVVISNTTEAGIVLVEDNIHAAPPISFPGKLLAFLYKRYQFFNGDINAGLVILPTELISDNGKKLRDILLTLAEQNKLGKAFANWLIEANDFCSTLVDRIVPGALAESDNAAAEKQLGYSDDLLIMSEFYSLWAIETSSERARKKMSFAAADAGVVIVTDINKFKELKLRLLNGSHTFTCGLAILQGFTTVKEAMATPGFYEFIAGLIYDEIVPSVVTNAITEAEAKAFATNVLDRYRNPFIEHKWLSITLQYSMKMKLRNAESIERFYLKKGKVPVHMAKGFAAYILFMHASLNSEGKYIGNINGKAYVINDDHAGNLYEKWQKRGGIQLVENILSDTNLWNTNLAKIPGLTDAIYSSMLALQQENLINVAI